MDSLTILSILVIGAAIVGVASFIINQRREVAFADRWNKANDSEALKFAAKYWADALRDGAGAELVDEDDRRGRFRRLLQANLAGDYARNKCFADIGVFYYAPHEFGADNILWGVLRSLFQVPAINRDVSHARFRGEGRMCITFEEVTFTPTCGEKQVLWAAPTALEAVA